MSRVSLFLVCSSFVACSAPLSPVGAHGPTPDATEVGDADGDLSDTTGDDTTSDEPSDREPQPLEPSHFSPVGQAVLAELEAYDGGYGTTWNLSGDSELDADWLLQTPAGWHWDLEAEAFEVDPRCSEGPHCDPDFELRLCETDDDCGAGTVCEPLAASVTTPDDEPTLMCVGHSDTLLDAIYETIVVGEEHVDIASLTMPDGRFGAAVRNALTYLDRSGSTANVRVLSGAIPGLWMDPEDVLADLTRDVAADTGLTVNLGHWRMGLDSWNHAKIVAADGAFLLQGGHNMWTEDYLGIAPMHDLSMRVQGAPAGDAHRFLDAQWETLCEDYWFDGWTDRASFPAHAADCPPDWGMAPEAPFDGGVRTISVGRLGALGEDPADVAQWAMVRGAEHTVRLSLQDIGPIRLAGDLAVSDWPEELFFELTYAMVRGVDVEIVLSSPDSTPGADPGLLAGYWNGWTLEEVAAELEEWILDQPGLVSDDTDVHGLLCDRLTLAQMRFSDEDDTWNNGAGVGNHAKLLVADDTTFYLGSQNLYLSDLAEFGLIVDDEEITAELMEDYWTPMWTTSVRTAVSGPDSGCRW